MFQNWCLEHGYERAAELIDENWEQMVSRRSRRYGCAPTRRSDSKKVANATAVVWKMLLVAARKFRRINSPELLPAVAAGQQYHDGLPGQRRPTPGGRRLICLHTP